MKKTIIILLFVIIGNICNAQHITNEMLDSVSVETYDLLRYSKMHNTGFTLTAIGSGILLIDLADEHLSQVGKIVGPGCMVAGFAAFWLSEKYLKRYALTLETKNNEIAMVYRFNLSRNKINHFPVTFINN